MARTREPQPGVGLPKIQGEGPRSLRLTLPSALAADLEAYRRAYKAAYGAEVELETLIPHMLAMQLRADRNFKTWRASEESKEP